VKREPQPSVAQPWDAWVNASVFEFRIEVAQNRRRCGLMLKAIDADLDSTAASLHPSLDTVNELAMDEFRRLVLIGRPEIMAEVVHDVESKQTKR